MKNLFVVILFFVSLNVFGATRYWVGGGSSSNWNATGPTNWSATSGGANNASSPGLTDDVIFDGVGATANTNSGISASVTILSYTVSSGYTANINHGNGTTLTVAGNVTWHSGFTFTGAGAMTISATSTITSGGKTFGGQITLSGASTTKTLVGNFVTTGLLALSGSNQTLNATTNETFSSNGFNVGSQMLAGSAKIILTGGTWTNGFGVANDMDIAGNVTVSGGVVFGVSTAFKTLTYVSGTVTTAGSSLNLVTGTTINTNGITWNNVVISGSGAISISITSTLTISGTLTINNGISLTLGGTHGFVAHTVACNHISSATQTFVNGVTYTITNAFNAFASRTGSILAFTSNHASNKAIITLAQGATCNVLASFTRIDASGGRPIRTFNGTVTDCVNIYPFNDVGVSKH